MDDGPKLLICFTLGITWCLENKDPMLGITVSANVMNYA